jgi:excisionase family DNA binding protein
MRTEWREVMERKLMTTEEVARFLQVSPETVRKWRYQNAGPRSIRVSYRNVRYEKEEVERWLAMRSDKNTH